MNTNTLSARVDEQHYHHQPQHPVRRVGLADRVALHLGLALVTWSRRPVAAAQGLSRDARAARHRHDVARTQRENEWQRSLGLGQARH